MVSRIFICDDWILFPRFPLPVSTKFYIMDFPISPLMDDIEKLQECPDCASTNVVYIEARDQIVCRDCGLVFEPLVPEVEEAFEKTHGLKLGIKQPKGKSKKPVAKAKPSKARPKKPAKKKR